MSLPDWSRAKLLRSFALDRGFATAEFAIVLPAVVLVGAMLLWVLSLFITQLEIQSASYSIARDISRGQIINANLESQLPADYKVRKTITNNFVTVEIGVRKPLMNQRLPWGIELSAIAISELERSNASSAN